MMAKILVVDDHQITARSLRRLLLGCGHTCDCVGSGGAALVYLTTQRVDLVVLDYNLLAIDGVEVVRRLRASVRTASVPIALFSAAAEGPARDAALGAGATEWWPKGALDADGIESAVSRILDHPSGA